MNLRYAYNTNGTGRHRLDDALVLISEAGYDGVALTLDHHHFDPFADDWERRAEALRRRLDELGLGVGRRDRRAFPARLPAEARADADLGRRGGSGPPARLSAPRDRHRGDHRLGVR